jgi:proteic killer suppression protein
MEVEYDDDSLRRLETDPGFTAGLDAAVVQSFRHRMQLIRAAIGEKTFSALRFLRYQPPQGPHSLSSMSLTDQHVLALRVRQADGGASVAQISSIDFQNHPRTTP